MNGFIFIICFLLAGFFVIFSEKFIIKILQKIGFKQNIRQEGPESHVLKQGTLTGAGIIFIIAPIIFGLSGFLYSIFNINFKPDWKFILWVSLAGILSGLIGFADDYLKKVKNQNEGLKPREKLLAQIIVSGILCFGLNINSKFSSLFFFTEIPMGIIIGCIFIMLVIIATMNAVNLTDGLDGLASSVCLWSFLGLIPVAKYISELLFLPSSIFNIYIFSFIYAGICLGFWFLNKKPAKFFMGDTGSFFLGGSIAFACLYYKLEWFLFLILLIPVIEAFSVILQVLSCKLSKKFLKKDLRLFKMTPFHHHLELSNWEENQVVFFLSLIQALIVILFCFCVFIS